MNAHCKLSAFIIYDKIIRREIMRKFVPREASLDHSTSSGRPESIVGRFSYLVLRRSIVRRYTSSYTSLYAQQISRLSKCGNESYEFRVLPSIFITFPCYGRILALYRLCLDSRRAIMDKILHRLASHLEKEERLFQEIRKSGPQRNCVI
jgi:hypothetical protein